MKNPIIICMRRIVYLFIIALMPVLTFAQGAYEPFLKEGKTWKYNHDNPFTGNSYMYSVVVRGDTVINDLTYKKIYDVSSDAYQYALREDGQIVYGKFQNSDTPKLLYDFGKNAGETVSEVTDNDWKTVVKVVSVDQVKYGDRLLRRMKVVEDYLENDEVYDSNYSTWIEGIGSECDLTCPFRYDGNYNNFNSCWIGDEVLGDITLFSAPTAITSIKDIPNAGHRRSVNSDTPIYNLAGQKVNVSYKGIVIQNGKKKLVK